VGAAAAALALLLIYPPLGGALAARRAAATLRERLGIDVAIGQARAGLTGVVFRAVRVGGGPGAVPPLARLDVVRVPFAAALFRRGTVTIDGALFDVRRGGDDDNVTAVLNALRAKRTAPAGQGGAGHEAQVPALKLTNAKVKLHDGGSGLTVDIEKVNADLAPGSSVQVSAEKLGGLLAVGNAGQGPRFGAGALTIAQALTGLHPRGYPTVTVEGAFATPLPKLSLTGIHGKIVPTTKPAAPGSGEKPGEELTVDLDGSYGGARETLWTARGGLDPASHAGQLSLRAERFSLGEIADVLPKTILSPANTNVDAAFDVSWAEGAVRFGGNMRFTGLSFQHPALAAEPIQNVDVGLVLRATAFPAGRRVAIDRLEGSIGELHGKLSGFVELAPGSVTFSDGSKVSFRPRLDLTLEIPKLPCAKALASLPPAVVPHLQGFVLKGTFGADITTRIDYADLDAMELKGKIGIDGCQVVKVPPEVKALVTGDSIPQSVEVPVLPGSQQAKDGLDTEMMDFVLGPENPEFVPYDEISPFLTASIMTTEDNGFFKHRGWVSSEFRTALKRNLERGAFRGGASSITMQMVKNVLLSQQKTLSRKLQELFLVWYIEQEVPKERILELYFNAIEFGPRIYGIGRATQHYFGKRPSELTPLEAAFFSSILPSPKRRYIQYCHGAPLPPWDRYVRRILAKVHERGRISDEDYAAAQSQKLVFDRSDAGMNERQCLDWVKKMTARPEPEVPAESDALDASPDGDDSGPLPVGKLRRLFTKDKDKHAARTAKGARHP